MDCHTNETRWPWYAYVAPLSWRVAAHVHDGEDKVYVVLEGCGLFRIGSEIREVGEKNAVLVPAGQEHSVKNDGAAPLVLLMFVAPRPKEKRKSTARRPT
jgi:mannose-6-phosphate isomerase-like protein (cupin superfamily)